MLFSSNWPLPVQTQSLRMRYSSAFYLRFLWQMHLVFYNDIYGNFKDAVSKPDGLVVIGVFLQVVFVLCFFLTILINLFNF